MVVAVATAVCGSVLTTLLASTAGAPPVGALLATILGAAIPPLIATAGPFHAVRLYGAVLAAAIGLAIAYGGFSVTYVVSGEKPKNLPLPGEAKGSGHSSGKSGGSVLTESGKEPGIEVSPDSVELTCVGRGQGCLKTVTLKSTGDVPLRIGNIVAESDGVSVAAEDCAHKEFAKGANCTLALWLVAEGAPTRVVIHQNLPGKPSYVRVSRPSGPSSPPVTSPEVTPS
ncbi:hypothetical protein [Actinomadura rupiterrae]|uniref:hypothetical protein n=1 Tax=Actinomadura rupiterrae TaxID=559627 RepID=UPI0020A3990A|nr:hypothetical protein [Actinomadura rupiterrae]MCP2339406.1 hypothetical protein [Actinomadura rupiterrae]